MKVRVAVNGFGVIGRRVADAIRAQSDMELAGIVDVATDWRMQVARERDFAIHGATAEAVAALRAAGFEPRGDLGALLARTDVVVDCTPKGVDAPNRELYEAAGVRCIFQGGAKHELAGHSFVACANFASALDRKATSMSSPSRRSRPRMWGVSTTGSWTSRAPRARTRCWRRSWRCRGSPSSGSATVSRRSM